MTSGPVNVFTVLKHGSITLRLKRLWKQSLKKCAVYSSIVGSLIVHVPKHTNNGRLQLCLVELNPMVAWPSSCVGLAPEEEALWDMLLSSYVWSAPFLLEGEIF